MSVSWLRYSSDANTLATVENTEQMFNQKRHDAIERVLGRRVQAS